MTDAFDAAAGELRAAAAGIAPVEIDTACAIIAAANRIVLYGCGREGLQLRGFAMRLHHLGRDVAMQGDMAAPPVGPGDLFVASAGPGELATVTALMKVARAAGADILFLTAEPDAPTTALATHRLVIPAQTMARDLGPDSSAVLPMGSVYEGALFLLFEIMVLRLRADLGITPERMRANHTNLE
ncbi:SIS domain-containing protein [Tropicimonas sp. IMCC6043]|uniref:SIS domain-containing protein n=1 Tax=Tropicimonas sp. IMCC6043 TaxID=2510645 RepID=UPI00101C6617|nr:SIS domain-containing protein [Tropicimonas sp. IMCC6043]RYH06995.1 SIS domain-containing protein [Tropicimonas sp. IMCC6043]